MKRYLSLLLLVWIFQSIESQNKLPAWKAGNLDVHFISTGGGNCAFIIMPDGTTLLVDAGELNPTNPRTLSPRNTARFPNYSKKAYEWQSDYIKDLNMPIDYALITHFHEDHYGSMYDGVSKSSRGDYYLSGITGLGDLIPIGTLVDRGWDYPANLRTTVEARESNAFDNYMQFVSNNQKRTDFKHEAFHLGSSTQFSMLHDAKNYPSFQIENIVGNGKVFIEGKIKSDMPALEDVNLTSVHPGENQLSCGIMLRYGNFKFFMGADIPGSSPSFEQKPKWADIETLAAPAIGEVDVTTTNHHANRDAMTPFYLSILKPRVIIQEVWSSDHPGHEALIRMTSQKIWTGDRDLFSTNMLEANRLVIGELIDNSYQSTEGHIVVRVHPDGNTYKIYTLNHRNSDKQITGVFGPYQTKLKSKMN